MGYFLGPLGKFFPEIWPPYFWKPWMSPYVAAGAFFFQDKWSLDFGGDSQMDLDLDISSL